jgi:hypothetical protein
VADDANKGEKKSGAFLAKVFAGIFGAILAPIAVIYITKWIDTTTAPPSPTSPSPPPPTKSTGPIIPGGVVHLLTPKLSDHFYSYAWTDKEVGKERYITDDNVDPSLFKMDPNTKELVVVGERLGALTTKEAYKSYLLTIEYKWGEKSYGDLDGKARRCLLLVNGQGGDGSGGKEVLLGYLIGMSEGFCGNMTAVSNGTTPALITKATVKTKERTVPGPKPTKGAAPPGKPQWVYDPNGTEAVWDHGWVLHLGAPPKYDDVKGVHPPGDPSKPGDWNKLEVYSHGGLVKVRVNGSKDLCVFEKTSRQDGKIQILPQKSELVIRRMDVEPARW